MSSNTGGTIQAVSQADEYCDYLDNHLTIFVVGASGDLAKKKTYPSLYDLHRREILLPAYVTIVMKQMNVL